MPVTIDDISDKIIKIIPEHLGCSEDKVHLGAVFSRDLKMSADDLDLVELVMRAEHEFKISIEESVSNKIISVQDLVLAVAGYVINPAFHDAMPVPVPTEPNTNHEGRMSFWKILGGVAVGVGAVAAAPFTGGGSVLAGVSLMGSLAGAGTVAAAVGAGAVGGAIGASMGDSDDKAREEAYQQGRKEAKAENQAALENLQEKLVLCVSKLGEAKRGFNAIIAMEAVAIACANCDGEISAEEREQIEMFISGASRSSLPADVKRTIEDLYVSPPSIREAFTLAAQAGVDMDVFDDIIAVVMHADGIVHEKERVFVQAWNRLRAA